MYEFTSGLHLSSPGSMESSEPTAFHASLEHLCKPVVWHHQRLIIFSFIHLATFSTTVLL